MDRVTSYASFLKADMSMSDRDAHNVALVMLLSTKMLDIPMVQCGFHTPRIFYPRGSKHPRVYVSLWSQNSMRAVRFVEHVYFDAATCEMMAKFDVLGTSSIGPLFPIPSTSFSGSRTRAVMEATERRFRCLKFRKA